ncbi:MAG: glycosyltransferase [Acidobacteria bacterium]|nr:glycosyltransferase [Acidobacteriota bacterium]
MMHRPRIAIFTDTFHEVNGVALTCRQFAAHAAAKGAPFLRVHPGAHTRTFREGAQSVCELAASPLSIRFEADLCFDLRFLRHKALLRAQLEQFQPDWIHVTSPGHISILGVILAHELGIPLAASWHTNVHQFGARRLANLLSFLPGGLPAAAAEHAEFAILKLITRYYRIARLLFAPNPELCQMLTARTGKPVHPMHRGVDLDLYRPRPETRSPSGPLTIGYVGRLTPEKNLRLLAALHSALGLRGIPVRFLIVGQGSEEAWLRANIPSAELPGVLRGEALARAYASMDIFAFPSQTDTYGNVVQEAKACGVPVVVTSGGGPKYLVQHGVDGLITSTDAEFVAAIILLAQDHSLRSRLAQAAFSAAQSLSWGAVFTSVYQAYAGTASTDAHTALRPSPVLTHSGRTPRDAA